MSTPAGMRGRGTIITVLGLTQIMAWGSSYYLPAVIAPAVARDTGWPLAWVVGGLSLGLMVAGLISPRVGSSIERHGGRNVLAFSAVCIGAGQIGLAMAPSLAAYIAAWLVIGLGMGAGLYDAAFATLGRLYGGGARSAITTLTLFGGFASTVCWPISAFLMAAIGWRGACLAYAAVQLLIALPLYLTLLPRRAPQRGAVSEIDRNVAATAGNPSFPVMALLATTITLAAVISSTLSVHLLSILQAGGLALAAAVGLGALVGPSQVTARAVEMMIARYHHPIWTKLVSASFVAIGVLALWTGMPAMPVALGFYGAGIGLESIARGTLPLALFGPSGYAKLMGRLAMPSLIAQSAAPSLGALLMQCTGAQGTLAVLGALALLNVVLACGLRWLMARNGRLQLQPG
ncbi:MULTISPECIES: MFS transporter [Mesorhizobium]|uniref:MFS transporter n=1 Tax=Mesorhizobium TaxID=68287 RepID=UPI000FCAB834|nr:MULTISPECIES: MFS transporter [Mesorhizobium]MDX8433814.1 MFS transporter [Mesorhizobium abyssinicae]RUW75023.1 MFS transporter [Mesorhizobium sp. M4B.F.Ca.ET.049.02.1.2]RVD21072.1 MFS transporter [Mesorhizobium sp. M4B.F.Ca.ET.017.02.2.1]RWC96308.1 MAG: MFS transporter [Mesorhizobium sp.]RWF28465.1 MAG: MFS transporter [Mesorhizobium sp.]